MYSKKSGPYFKTIFTTFDNYNLTIALEKFVTNNHFNIFKGEPSSPDIIVMPYFIAIIDRNILGFDVWRNFFEYNEEVADYENNCIILDNRKDLEILKFGTSIQIDINNVDSVSAIISTCERITSVTELQRCYSALSWYLTEKNKKSLQDEVLYLFQRYPIVKDYFFSEIISLRNEKKKDILLSDYFTTRSDEEIKIFIKEQFRQFDDVKIFYIRKLRSLYFENTKKQIYL